MGFCALSRRGVESVLFYLAVYQIAVLLAFLLMNRLSEFLGGDELRHYAGLAKRAPLAAFGLLAAFVSLAGIPPLAGFMGKLGVFSAVWEAGDYVLLGVGVAGAITALYYYLGIVRWMYWEEPEMNAPEIEFSTGFRVLICLLMSALFLLGVWQIPLAHAVSWVVEAGVVR
jgi:NADH-quinone oxidoreductase subunit N